jgi:EAL domain-containing protein (putative c-di-GMP-specific phosphodiesterase class I)
MDPQSRLIPSEHEVAPFFQPILSLQTGRIIGYETLGRRIVGDAVESLGPFFHNKVITDAEHLKIDRVLREKAIETLRAESLDSLLFINLKPSWIYQVYRETKALPTLQFIDKHSIDPSRVVIEITEEEFQGRLDELAQIVHLYRERGCLIAIDDIGSGFSNYDRIASIRPNILKIDLKLLKKSDTHEGYKALLNSFSILSSQMGASLLIEGIESKQDLYNALQAGARYVQGFLFSPATPGLLDRDVFQELLEEEVVRFTEQELARHRALLSVQDQLNELITGKAFIAGSDDADALIQSLLPRVTDNVVRIFICREDGRQISSNFTRRDDLEWEVDEVFRGSNWIWRPYFIPTILRLSSTGQGNLSQLYTDLDSSRPMQTYSCPLGGKHYLFLDLIV